MADRLTKQQRSKNMRAIKPKGSRIEQLLTKELWSKGYRYRRNVGGIFGRPDIVFLKPKVAVFCDSEFWHGKDWESKKNEIKSNRDFWQRKIERNIQRDIEVTKFLEEQDWIVIRMWGKEIIANSEKCAARVIKVLHKRGYYGKVSKGNENSDREQASSN